MSTQTDALVNRLAWAILASRLPERCGREIRDFTAEGMPIVGICLLAPGHEGKCGP